MAALHGANGIDDNSITASASQYGADGITDINTAAKASLMNDVIDKLPSTAVDTHAEIVALAAIVKSIFATAAGEVVVPALTPQDLAALGITGVDADNIDSVIVRPGHIYGPSIRDSDQRASAQFTRKAIAGEDVVLKSKGTQLRSYCYSLDCASAIITVLLEGEKANAYNISNPNSICTISDIAEQIAAAGDVKLAYEDATESGQVVNSLMQNASLDSTKLEQLGWKPTFDLKAGIKSMVETLRESKNPFSL
jgi:hypothetical protein